MAGPPLLRGQLSALASLATNAPKVLTQTVGAVATAAPQVASRAYDTASTMPTALGQIRPGPGIKAAFEMANVPVNPDTVGRCLNSVGQSTFGSRAQSHLDSVNEILSALGLRVWIVRPSSVHAQARVRVVAQETETCAKSEHTGLTPRQFVRFMHEARRSGSIAGLDSYIERLIAECRLQHIVLIPNAFEPKLYADVARLMIFIWHQSFSLLDGASVWGHKIKVSSTPALPTGYGSSTRRGLTHVGEAQIAMIVDEMLKSEAVNMRMIPDIVEKRIYVNCIMVIFQLLDDLVTGAGEEITCMGHAWRFSLEVQSLEILRQTLKDHPVSHCKLDESVLTELADEMLADSDVNLKWVPDIVERQIYKSVLRLMIRVMEEVVCRVKMKMLGRDIDVKILGEADVKEQKAQRSKEPEAVLYYAEEDPLATVSTTELEERLKTIDEQRRVLEAIQQLGGAQFDLFAERPMLQPGDPTPVVVAAGSVSDASQPSDTGVAAVDEEVHEFTRLAHTLKLGRSLSVRCDVEADIMVPWGMIADLETYPDWMPWCTSGKACGQKKEANGEGDYEGEVGFGFDTGSFIGTLSDTVRYRITTVAPGPSQEFFDQQPSRDFGRVKADATEGFAYGDKLVYDWRFKRLSPNLTRVELDMLFQAKSVLYMPFWDGMKNMVMNNMLDAFKARAEVLQRQRGNEESPPRAERAKPE